MSNEEREKLLRAHGFSIPDRFQENVCPKLGSADIGGS